MNLDVRARERVGQVHIFWKRFRPPWSSILETLGETAILNIQNDKKESSEIKKIKESSFWWATLNFTKTLYIRQAGKEV